MSATTSMPSATSATPSPTSTGTGNQKNDKSNNPLLFFVALGFGVVFTNLWIIVGVKYCFRYNARNRAARMLNEHGEPIDLDNMPQQNRRRRKEKKLMTMQEVNERFPLTKYKVFRSSREATGVSPEGAVATTPSRPASVRGVDGANDSPVVEAFGKQSEDTSRAHTAIEIAQQDHAEAVTSGAPRPAQQPTTSTDSVPEKGTAIPRNSSVATGIDDDEDDPIRTAAPAEMLDVPGDTCAICIDTLDDDDDVRGLTCGHAFHGSCVDPWLTSRRACCPLCKADYYTPKPGRPGANEENVIRVNRSEYDGTPQPPVHAWIGHSGFRPHLVLSSRGFFLGDQPAARMPPPATARTTTTTTTTTTNGEARPGFFGRLRPGGRNTSSSTTPTTANATEQPTPSTDPTIVTEPPAASRSWRSMMPRLRRGEESRGQEAELESGTRTVR